MTTSPRGDGRDPTRAISPRSLLRLLLVCGAVALLRVPMGANVTRLEMFWIALTWFSTVVAAWGLVKARRSSRWVSREQRQYPERDYTAAHISAVNHGVSHLVLLLVQLAWFGFGVALGFMPPGPSAGRHVTATQIVFTGVLIFVEVLLTGLNVFLVIRRQVLVNQVRAAGGD